MIKKVFINSDVILDVATGRIPFVENSRTSLSLIERGFAFGVVYSNSITNIYYVLRKLSSDEKARSFLKILIKYISIITVDNDNIARALESKLLRIEKSMRLDTHAEYG